MRRCVFKVLILVAAGCTTAPSVSSPVGSSATAPPVVTSSPSPLPASPTPEADQALITYEWFQEGNDLKSVFVARPDGSDAHAIAADIVGEQRGPTWSPDGQRIAFVVRGADDPEGTLWLMDADGWNAERLLHESAECPVGAFWPAWSPDGAQLAFFCYPSMDTEAIATLDLASGGIEVLASFHNPDHVDNPPSWSPDGATIVFDLQHWDPTNEFLDGTRIGAIPAAGGDITWLTEMDAFTAWPQWHPTQDLIAYNTYDLGNMHEVDQPSNIWTMRSDGSDPQQLTTLTAPVSERVAQARWLPDGTGLIASCAYGNPVSNVQICRVDPTTGEISDLMHVIPGARPDMRPTQ